MAGHTEFSGQPNITSALASQPHVTVDDVRECVLHILSWPESGGAIRDSLRVRLDADVCPLDFQSGRCGQAGPKGNSGSGVRSADWPLRGSGIPSGFQAVQGIDCATAIDRRRRKNS